MRTFLFVALVSISLSALADKTYSVKEFNACSCAGVNQKVGDRMVNNAISHAKGHCGSNGVKRGHKKSHWNVTTTGRKDGPACAGTSHSCKVSGTIECKSKPASSGSGYYAYKNPGCCNDRYNELRQRVGSFTFIDAGGTFKDLCRSINKTCKHVVDWEGARKSCTANPGDGSRVAFCQ